MFSWQDFEIRYGSLMQGAERAIAANERRGSRSERLHACLPTKSESMSQNISAIIQVSSTKGA